MVQQMRQVKSILQQERRFGLMPGKRKLWASLQCSVALKLSGGGVGGRGQAKLRVSDVSIICKYATALSLSSTNIREGAARMFEQAALV